MQVLNNLLKKNSALQCSKDKMCSKKEKPPRFQQSGYLCGVNFLDKSLFFSCVCKKNDDLCYEGIKSFSASNVQQNLKHSFEKLIHFTQRIHLFHSMHSLCDLMLYFSILNPYCFWKIEMYFSTLKSFACTKTGYSQCSLISLKVACLCAKCVLYTCFFSLNV